MKGKVHSILATEKPGQEAMTGSGPGDSRRQRCPCVGSVTPGGVGGHPESRRSKKGLSAQDSEGDSLAV